MPNDDLVYRDDLIRVLNDALDNMHDPDSVTAKLTNMFVAIIESMDAAKAKPIAYASWVKEEDRYNHWHCSKCKTVQGIACIDMKYCPYCGAKIIGSWLDEAD